MIKINKYNVPHRKSFSLKLRDDNNVINAKIPWLSDDMVLHVVEDDINDRHLNNFILVGPGEDMPEEGPDGSWMHIGNIGELFLFQNSSWEA